MKTAISMSAWKYLVAEVGFETAENETLKTWIPNLSNHLVRLGVPSATRRSTFQASRVRVGATKRRGGRGTSFARSLSEADGSCYLKAKSCSNPRSTRKFFAYFVGYPIRKKLRALHRFARVY